MKIAMLVVLIVSVFLVGCASSSTDGYGTYNQPQGQGQQPYVGGGCGVAPSADYSEPVKVSESVSL